MSHPFETHRFEHERCHSRYILYKFIGCWATQFSRSSFHMLQSWLRRSGMTTYFFRRPFGGRRNSGMGAFKTRDSSAKTVGAKMPPKCSWYCRLVWQTPLEKRAIVEKCNCPKIWLQRNTNAYDRVYRSLYKVSGYYIGHHIKRNVYLEGF